MVHHDARAERASRAGTVISWARIVAVRALAWKGEAVASHMTGKIVHRIKSQLLHQVSCTGRHYNRPQLK